jgi:prepilin-type N-terminal cleavage/methylation domain-containing protein
MATKLNIRHTPRITTMLRQQRSSTNQRRGISLIEVLVTMAVLVILGGILAPTLSTMSGSTKSKAAADTLRGRIADARGAAIDDARPYRLAMSPDGLRLRVSPDDQAFMNMAATGDEDDAGPLIAESDLPDGVKIEMDADGAEQVTDEAGWVRIATFLADGTCREDSATLTIREAGVKPIRIRIRGLTGTAATLEEVPQ